MEKIYIIGDMHTVSAFRLSGVEGVVAAPADASARLEEIIGKKNAGIVLMTNDLTHDLQARIRRDQPQYAKPRDHRNTRH